MKGQLGKFCKIRIQAADTVGALKCLLAVNNLVLILDMEILKLKPDSILQSYKTCYLARLE